MLKKKRPKPGAKPKTSPKKKTASISLIVVLIVLISALAFFLVRQFSSLSGSRIAAGPPLPPGSAPEVVSAKLLPEKPQSNTPLTVQYEGRGPENMPIQYTFRWYVNGGIVQEGPNATLDPGFAKKGESLSVEIIPSNLNGPGKPFMTQPVQIANLPPVIASISLDPSNPVVGDTITAAAAGEDPDRDEVTFRYQWTVNGEPAAGVPPDSNRFNTQGLRKNDKICVTVTPSDRESTGTPKLSEIITLNNSAPRITSTPPTSLENGIYSYQIAAVDPDGDRLIYSLVSAPEGMTINPSTGLIRWEPPKQVTEKQEVPVKIKVEDGGGGSVYQEYSLFLEVK